MAASSLINSTFSIHHSFNLTLRIPQISPQNLRLQKPIKYVSVSATKLTSEPLTLAAILPIQKNIYKFSAQKVATLLLGSLVFMGSFKSSPVLALPVQESEQKEDAQFENSSQSEEELMYVKLLKENPKNIDALKMIVNVKMRKGKSSEAVEYVEKLIELQPTEMEWRLLQALCYEMIGNYSKAKGLFRNILKQQPFLLRALHGLAMVLHKNHEGSAMFEMLNKALESAHDLKKVNEERNIRILIAQMHIVKGDFEDALQMFQYLIAENPRDFRPYLCQGIVYSLLEKRKEAEESFEIYRGLVPEEFPQRGFLDDVVMAAKTESRQQLEKDLRS